MGWVRCVFLCVSRGFRVALGGQALWVTGVIVAVWVGEAGGLVKRRTNGKRKGRVLPWWG